MEAGKRMADLGRNRREESIDRTRTGVDGEGAGGREDGDRAGDLNHGPLTSRWLGGKIPGLAGIILEIK
jgi:hypothetical protein